MRKTNPGRAASVAALLAIGITFASCRANGYTASLTLTGLDHQRALAEDVTETTEVLVESQEEFTEAFALVGRLLASESDDDALDLYDELLGQIDDCAEHVGDVRERTARLSESGGALFSNWKSELDEFSSPEMRAESEGRMQRVQYSLDALVVRLTNVQTGMETALVTLRDYVLFFNHNLNRQAIAAMQRQNERLTQIQFGLRDELEGARREAQLVVGHLRGTVPTN